MTVCTVVALVGALLPRPIGAATPHELRFTEGVDVTTLDPLLSNVASTTDLAQLTMAHFVRIDTQNRIVPELIVAVPSRANGGLSADGKTITYRLRHGVRWSDGAPFDSADVVFTFGVIANARNNITQRDAFDRVTTVDAPDAYTVRVHLRASYGAFATRFFGSDTTSCILPKHVLAGLATINEAPYNALPVGIGPFRYTAFRRGDAVEMEANPYYFRGRPKLDRIVYKTITDENTVLAQMQTGELDMWGTVGGTFYDRVRAVPGLDVTISASSYMAGIYLNTTRPVLANPAVRRALVLATDRAFILEKINHGAGTLAQSVVPSISRDVATLPRTRYDPGAAQRLLESAGWQLGSDGVRHKGDLRLSVTLVLPTGYVPSQITAEYLRSAWQKIGVAVETKPSADAQYFAPASENGTLASGAFDAALLSVSGNYDADETTNFACRYVPPNGFNFDRYCDPALDAEMTTYDHAIDPRQRAQIAERIQRTIDAATPTIIMYERGFIYAYAHRVHGFHPGHFTAYDDFMNVDVSP